MDTDQVKTSEEKTIDLYNKSYSENYRAYDEKFITESAYHHFSGLLRTLTTSFDRPISVLEIGCGTGRYFHTLLNTYKLTGIDISKHMLELAQQPVKGEDVAIQEIKLIAGSVYDYDFNGETFDFIYSIGVLGEHVPLTVPVLNKIYGLLKMDGTFFTTVVDLDVRKNLKRKLAEVLYPILTSNLKRILDKRWTTNYLTLKDTQALMKASAFTNYRIENHFSEDNSWPGGHYKIIAKK